MYLCIMFACTTYIHCTYVYVYMHIRSMYVMVEIICCSPLSFSSFRSRNHQQEKKNKNEKKREEKGGRRRREKKRRRGGRRPCGSGNVKD